MFKTVYRSILGELIVTFFLTLAFLNSILIMEKLLRLSRILSEVGATAFDMARIITYLQPQLLLLTLPMSLLLATLLVYGRMNHDNEIIILKTIGMNFIRISSPVMAVGFFCFLFSIFVSFYLGPKSSVRLRNEITRIIAARSAFAIEEGTFNTSFKDIVILVKNKKTRNILEDIFIYDSRSSDEPKVLLAKEGNFFLEDESSLGLLLKHGYINITKDFNTTELFFDSYKFAVALDADRTPRKSEFTPAQLLEKSEKTDSEKKKLSFYLEFYRRLSLPFVCLLLIFLGPPLSMVSGKSGRLGGLAIGLLVFTVYYLMLIYGENLVSAGKIPHYLGGWLATFLLGIFSFLAFRRENSR
jgi:lipopolysaccharide export system permease protein